MKKLTLLLFSLLVLGLAFQSCSNSTKTYAEKQADEEKAIKDFIKTKNIKVISSDEFLKDTTTAENEYAFFSNEGIYLHVDKKGGTLPKTNDVILTRFLEINIATGDSTLSNYYDNTSIDQFRYTKTSTSTYGQFFMEQSQKAYMLTAYGSAVPAGWLLPLLYVGDGAKIKVLVPSAQGHSTAQQYVTPYFYEIEYKIY
ncbi:DUF4827 domain-containing protein [uncultured Bacteroides sp.]|uniref:DUF4827 domain-containing protein n=1 Tax=uncultured Bacteroides sp. TaxID=162156 RepID=UPI002AA6BBDE|nr:DUF4827 domain-containing protein [uncultured Bacteroides sp.]